MTLPTPFTYSPEPHQRKHGPAGYRNYQDYKPWLRDEFTFRCVYCLERELWYPDRQASFSADHVEPQKDAPLRVCDYTNLVYACTRCNSYKMRVRLIDPTAVGFGIHLRVDEKTGVIHAVQVDGKPSRDGELIIRLLHLNEDPALSNRLYAIDVLALKQEFPTGERVHRLFLQTFGYPDDLPDLRGPRPPDGNRREGSERAAVTVRSGTTGVSLTPTDRRSPACVCLLARMLAHPASDRFPSQFCARRIATVPPMMNPSELITMALASQGPVATYAT